MIIRIWINEKEFNDDAAPDMMLLEYLRYKGFFSVKRGCETSNCGMCTVLMEGKPVLSCATLAVRANGKHITTLEGLEKEALELGGFMADEGTEQCGFCNPGFIMNVIAMKRELVNPGEDDIKKYLMGNLCRCSGYMGQFRAVKKYLESTKEGAK